MTTAGKLLCTRCGYRKPVPFFALRPSGRPYSWCRQCKREYDRQAARAKALKEKEVLFAAKSASARLGRLAQDNIELLKPDFEGDMSFQTLDTPPDEGT